MIDTIYFKLTAPPDWMDSLHRQIDSRLMDDKLEINKNVGVGKIQYHTIQKGLYITTIDVSLQKPLKLVREAKAVNDYFILNFYLTTAQISSIRQKEEVTLSYDHFGILLVSAMMDDVSVLPANHNITVFNITISKDWIMENILNNNPTISSNLSHIFSANSPICIYESLNYRLTAPIKNILNQITKPNKLFIFSNVLTIINEFFEKIELRQSNALLKINPGDLQKILHSKEQIETHFKDLPSVTMLAQEAGMSLSKYKRLFKEIIGETPYQFHVINKMRLAKTLLLTGDYSVSEVGYAIGYTNLSQFTRLFKKHNAVLPSAII